MAESRQAGKNGNGGMEDVCNGGNGESQNHFIFLLLCRNILVTQLNANCFWKA